MYNINYVFPADVSQHVLFPQGCVALLIADHLNAYSGAPHIAEHQDRLGSGLPCGSRSGVILAAFQIK